LGFRVVFGSFLWSKAWSIFSRYTARSSAFLPWGVNEHRVWKLRTEQWFALKYSLQIMPAPLQSSNKTAGLLQHQIIERRPVPARLAPHLVPDHVPC
jgi:hypothetical protein